jgi:hypothetical protein
MKSKAYLSLIVILLFCVSSAANASTIEGKLERFGKYGILPASFVSITLCSDIDKKNLQTVISDSKGMYYFGNIEAGTYILKVWVNGFKEKALNYKIGVTNNKDLSIKPILIHSLRFDRPEENARIKVGTYIIQPGGIYYSITNNTSLWIAFSSKYNDLYFSDNPVTLHKDGTWTAETIFSYPKNITQINVIMITEEESKKLQKKASEDSNFPKIKDIPKNSYRIIASRKIQIVK